VRRRPKAGRPAGRARRWGDATLAEWPRLRHGNPWLHGREYGGYRRPYYEQRYHYSTYRYSSTGPILRTLAPAGPLLDTRRVAQKWVCGYERPSFGIRYAL